MTTAIQEIISNILEEFDGLCGSKEMAREITSRLAFEGYDIVKNRGQYDPFKRDDDEELTMGTPLNEPCGNASHGRFSGFDEDHYDPSCHTCMARHTIYGLHDHLHLAGSGRNSKAECPECSTPGLVRCKCGGYH